MSLRSVGLDDLTIDDESSFAHVGAYTQLKAALRRSTHRFRIPEPGAELSWDRATFLNLTFWSGEDGADVLTDDRIPADVVAHVAWHHLVHMRIAREVAPGPSDASALRFAESIASAFDLYLVGRLMRNAPDSEFIATQVPIMSAAAEQGGLDEDAFAELLEGVVEDPERAFEDLRALLLDVMTALAGCRGVDDAVRVLDGFREHRFAPLLHHYELSNWVLYGRAYGVDAPDQQRVVRALDEAMRNAPVSLDLLMAECLPGA